MALGDSYATLAQLKTRLNIPDTNSDAALTSALSAASRSIEAYCGRQFNDAGSASARVYYPDSLTVCKTEDFSTTNGLIVALDFSNAGNYSTILSATSYQLEPLNGVVDGTPGFPYNLIRLIQTWYPLWYASIGDPRASVQITAQWGWAAVPAPVVEGCLMLAEETFKMKDAPFGVAGFSEYGAVRVRDNPKVSSLLARYRVNPILIA